MIEQFIVRCVDVFGREVRLHTNTWHDHIIEKHTEFQSHHTDCIQEALMQPTIVTYDADRKNAECFYREGGHPDDDYGHLYVKVCVKFPGDGDVGYVSTALVTSRLKSNEARKWTAT